MCPSGEEIDKQKSYSPNGALLTKLKTRKQKKKRAAAASGSSGTPEYGLNVAVSGCREKRARICAGVCAREAEFSVGLLSPSRAHSVTAAATMTLMVTRRRRIIPRLEGGRGGAAARRGLH